MSREEHDILQRIAEAVNELPEGEKKYVLGYAEGVAAAAAEKKSAYLLSPTFRPEYTTRA